MTNEVHKQEKILSDTEAAMQTYRETNNAQVSRRQAEHRHAAALDGQRLAVEGARGARLDPRRRTDQVKGADPARTPPTTSRRSGRTERVVAAKGALNSATATRDDLRAKGFGPSYAPLVKAEQDVTNARAALVAARGAVIESIKNEYNAAAIEERQTAAQPRRSQEQPDGSRPQERRLQRAPAAGRQRSRTLYNQLLTQQKELRCVANSRANNVQVDGPRRSAGVRRSRRTRGKDWITAILAGIIVAFGLAFGIEYLDDTVKTPEDITRRLKLPLLGLVPGDSRRPRAGADRDGAARFRRGVPIAAHVARLHERRRAHARHRRHEQPAARGQDDDRGNLALALALGGSRVLLDRRRHAAARACTRRMGMRERHRPVAPAGRAGARARRGAAHDRAEPAA